MDTAIASGIGREYEFEVRFEVRAKKRPKIILPGVFFVIFMLPFMIFHSATEAMVLASLPSTAFELAIAERECGQYKQIQQSGCHESSKDHHCHRALNFSARVAAADRQRQ